VDLNIDHLPYAAPTHFEQFRRYAENYSAKDIATALLSHFASGMLLAMIVTAVVMGVIRWAWKKYVSEDELMRLTKEERDSKYLRNRLLAVITIGILGGGVLANLVDLDHITLLWGYNGGRWLHAPAFYVAVFLLLVHGTQLFTLAVGTKLSGSSLQPIANLGKAVVELTTGLWDTKKPNFVFVFAVYNAAICATSAANILHVLEDFIKNWF